MSCESTKPTKLNECLKPIGYIRSIFNKKNGTPRQPSICPESKGYIELSKDVFNNPMHSVLGIQQFSHLWCASKVRPPRLNGKSCGVFASRSPHRPNPIGLSLVKLDSVEEGLLYISGIDILDGTPIVDIKPYIKRYDFPDNFCHNSETKSSEEIKNSLNEESNVPKDWVNGSVVSDICVEFSTKSLQQLKRFHKSEENGCDYCLKHLSGFEDSKEAITRLLSADPRSVYRRTKCVDRLYYFTIDSLHITSWFDIETNVVEVLKIKPFVTKPKESEARKEVLL